jgi:hypothetical protein
MFIARIQALRLAIVISVEPSLRTRHQAGRTARGSGYPKATLGFLGIGFLTAVPLSRLFWNGTTILRGGGQYHLTCQRMTVSPKEGKLVPGGEAADQRANIPCTPALMEKSRLCRDRCAADAS